METIPNNLVFLKMIPELLSHVTWLLLLTNVRINQLQTMYHHVPVYHLPFLRTHMDSLRRSIKDACVVTPCILSNIEYVERVSRI